MPGARRSRAHSFVLALAACTVLILSRFAPRPQDGTALVALQARRGCLTPRRPQRLDSACQRLASPEKDGPPSSEKRKSTSEADDDEEGEGQLPVYILGGCLATTFGGGFVLVTQGTDTPLFVLVALLVAITGAISVALGGLMLTQGDPSKKGSKKR
eukprot:CAMPEP_0197925068 /NCGR_PEP_ID=MMETSP1439-20131203/96790_1 /TAXON_ID=66791 /ORGANISM="Gonyaulax spinifera, Strain CCMP409" /LENGTH=156 /DNA_ID=CAMNT_0043547525 /DNA_START=1 /DNA_END=471 /DNA_ORIENTATION=+